MTQGFEGGVYASYEPFSYPQFSLVHTAVPV